jgi:hypothetical protein
MLITLFVAFCLEMWDVIEKCDFKFSFCKSISVNSFSWSCLIISSSDFFDRLVSSLANDACSFLIIEWRMFVLDLSSDVYDETSDLTKHFIKFDENDSSNLTKATHQIWRKRFIKFDEKDVISSNLTRTSFHQIWDRHLIKLLKKKTIFLFSDERSHAATRDMMMWRI